MVDAEGTEVKRKQAHKWTNYPAKNSDVEFKICKNCGVLRFAVPYSSSGAKHRMFLYADHISSDDIYRKCPDCLEMSMRKALR